MLPCGGVSSNWGSKHAGSMAITWNCNDASGRRVGPGLYLARCKRADRSETVKVVVAF